MPIDEPGPAFVPRAAAEMAAATKAHPYAAVTVAGVVAGVGAYKAFGLLRSGGPVSRMKAQATAAVKAVVRDWTADEAAVMPAAAPRKVIITPNVHGAQAAGDD